nr:FAD-dependent oxidoreductase [Candidatus Levybacteria bacterium]
MKVKLIKKQNETKDIITFTFEPEKKFNWIAGQYIILTIDHKEPDNRGKMRFFTISSAPFQKNPSITTRINQDESSSFKKALTALEIGNEIDAKGPDGDFIIDDLNKKYIFIIKGVGITPFISIIKQLTYENKKIDGLLLYINKDEIAFENELREILKKQSKLRLINLKNLDDTKSYILKNFKNNISKHDFYVSGASIMTLETEKFLDNLGVEKDNQKLDYFSGYKNN